LFPLAAGSAVAQERIAFRRVSTSAGVSSRTSFTTSSRVATEAVPPPLGPRPQIRSGATALQPYGGAWLGHAREPIRQAEDFVNDDHDRRLVLALGVHDPRSHRHALNRHVHVLAVP